MAGVFEVLCMTLNKKSSSTERSEWRDIVFIYTVFDTGYSK